MFLILTQNCTQIKYETNNYWRNVKDYQRISFIKKDVGSGMVLQISYFKVLRNRKFSYYINFFHHWKRWKASSSFYAISQILRPQQRRSKYKILK